MVDFVICKIDVGYYGFKLENIQRIIEPKELTFVSGSSIYVEGILNYEDDVIEIVNLRRVLNYRDYNTECKALFETLKGQHIAWVDALIDSINSDTPFCKTTNPNMCDFGKWLNKFISYDGSIREVLDEIKLYHSKLHLSAIDILKLAKIDKAEAMELLERETLPNRDKTLALMDTLITLSANLTISMKKILIYKKDNKVFGLIVDKIENIIHLNEGNINFMDTDMKPNPIININQVIDMDNKLICIVNSVNVEAIK